MRNYFVLFLTICSGLFWAQNIIHPEYISVKNNADNLEQTTDIHLFHIKYIQYIGHPKKSLTITYNNLDRQNPLLSKNYSVPNHLLNRQFNTHIYSNIEIFVDTKQSTPLVQSTMDITYDEIEKMNKGEDLGREINFINKSFDGYPVTITNLDSKKAQIIGFGNNAALGLEVLNKNQEWIKLYDYRKYNCGNDIQYIILKPNEIATVFEPRIIGNFKTKFRYRLGNIISNEFEGSINDNYLNELKQ